MLQVTVNSDRKYKMSFESGKVKINDQPSVKLHWDRNGNKVFLLVGDKPFVGYLTQVDIKEKKVWITINGYRFFCQIEEETDQLLKKLGFQVEKKSDMKLMEAPMPGLISKVFVSDGDEVVKGTPLFILNAMKMENIIKAPASGEVSRILVKQDENVEKGQTLIQF